MRKLLAILLVSVMVLSLCACDSSDYKKATELYNEGNYPAAMTAFAALGDYKNSADMVTSCRYFIASETLSAGDFSTAKTAFESLGDYLDSAELVKSCDYGIAKAAMDKGNLEEAVKGFTALGSYKDSADLLAAASDSLVAGKIVGKWVSEDIDATEFFIAGIDAAGEEMMDYFDFGKFLLKMDLEFTENGTFVLAFNREQFEAAILQVKTALNDGFVDYMTAALTQVAAQEGMTVEDVLAAYEVDSMDQFIELSLEMPVSDFIDTAFGEALDAMSVMMQPQNGTFTVEQGVVSLFLGTEAEIADYDTTADTITIDTDAEGPVADLYPFIFHRAG